MAAISLVYWVLRNGGRQARGVGGEPADRGGVEWGNNQVNNAFCNECRKLVPAEKVERDGKIFLVKNCPECGPNETMISSSAERYNSKRDLDTGYEPRGCALNCPSCRHSGRVPSFAFVDVTNRCNMNCPICCDNVPSMGFRFDPPMDYFDKLFQHLSELEPRPTVALFGGEPTVREDLFEIIELSRSYGLRTRVVTNGLKMADKEYCDRLLATRATILLSYDGANPETYVKLRGTDSAMKPKQEAIENIGASPYLRRGKVYLISCIARGTNHEELPELIDFYHSKRDFVNTVHLMPLAHTWEGHATDFEPERITTECLEQMVEDIYPGETVRFLPAGFVAQLSTVAESIGRAALPFLGAHPNCESVYLLVSDGQHYVPIDHYLKGTLVDVGHDLLKAETRLAEKASKGDRELRGLKKAVAKLRGLTAIAPLFLRHVRFGRLLKGKGPTKLWHAIALAFGLLLGRKTGRAMARHTNAQALLQLIILPFEDNHVIETERLERCPNLHVYLDPKTDEVKHVPVCAWRLFNRPVMREVAEHYQANAAVE